MMALPPAARFVSDAGRELAFGDVLEVLVDGQLDARTGGRRTLEAAEGVAAGVGVHRDRAGLAANLRVVGVLEAAQPLVVDADPAEQVRGQLLVRVETLALLDEADAVEVQRGDPLRLIRRDLPLHVRERAPLAEALAERLPILRASQSESAAQIFFAASAGSAISVGTA